MNYRKKPIVIEATQWFKNGDHPLDHEPIGIQALRRDDLYKYSEYLETEGSVVRYFRHPEVSGETACKHCSKDMHKHGWIDTLEGGHIVCPGDWIITGVKGEMYPCKPDIFTATYEPALWEEPVGKVRTVGGYPDESEHSVEWLCKYKDLKAGDLLYTTPQPAPVQETDDPHDKLIFVGYTNGSQILYANDRSHGGEGLFFKDFDNDCMIPLYMLSTHYHRLETTSFGEVTLERLRKVQQDTPQSQEGEQS